MKIYRVILVSILLTIVFAACSKYEEGPFVSLRSAEKRIAGDYLLDKYYINDELISLTDQGISNYRVVYNEDGTGTSYITSGEYTLETEFEWELDEKKENIRERSKGLNDEWSAWSDNKQILKLTADEFWIIDNNSEESTKFQFVEQ